jgi:hypothetical protein
MATERLTTIGPRRIATTKQEALEANSKTPEGGNQNKNKNQKKQKTPTRIADCSRLAADIHRALVRRDSWKIS